MKTFTQHINEAQTGRQPRGPVPSHSLDLAIAHLRAGGSLCVRTMTRVTMITPKTLAAFERAGQWLLKQDGEGYRLKSGKGSIYLMNPNTSHNGYLEFC